MMSSQQIARLSDEAAARAERAHIRPWVPGTALATHLELLHEGIRRMPNIGSYRPAGWRLLNIDELVVPPHMGEDRLHHTWAVDPYLMVDSSGFGGADEPALTFADLSAVIVANPTVGWAIVEAGQFQVVIGAFKRDGDGSGVRVRTPTGNIADVANAFASGSPCKCHNADTDGKRYRLHASDIARWEDGKVVFDWCGFYTRTTAAHMNAILCALGKSRRVSYSTAREAGTTTFTI